MLHVHNVHACMRIEKHDIGLTHEFVNMCKQRKHRANKHMC